MAKVISKMNEATKIQFKTVKDVNTLKKIEPLDSAKKKQYPKITF